MESIDFTIRKKSHLSSPNGGAIPWSEPSSTSNAYTRVKTFPSRPNMSVESGLSRDIQWHGRTTSRLILDSNNTSKATDQVNENSAEVDSEEQLNGKELVAVFNANTPDGSSVVRALSSSGAKVVAIVRVFTSKNTKTLLQIPRVTVKVADVLDAQAVQKALIGVHRAILCLSHWERFESKYEAEQAELILNACCTNHVPHLVFSTFEDTKTLREKGLLSQIIPDSLGRIRPRFKEMKELKRKARENRVQLTHMITSFLDQENSKKSLCVIVGENGKLIVQPHMMDT